MSSSVDINEIAQEIAASLDTEVGYVWLGAGVLIGLIVPRLLRGKRQLPPMAGAGSHGAASKSTVTPISSGKTTQFITSDSQLDITSNGQQIHIEGPAAKEIMEALSKRNVIQAIKVLRSETNLSLVDAKNVIEAIQRK